MAGRERRQPREADINTDSRGRPAGAPTLGRPLHGEADDPAAVHALHGGPHDARVRVAVQQPRELAHGLLGPQTTEPAIENDVPAVRQAGALEDDRSWPPPFARKRGNPTRRPALRAAE